MLRPFSKADIKKYAGKILSKNLRHSIEKAYSQYNFSIFYSPLLFLQIESIEMKMPNKHYYKFDFEKFQNLNLDQSTEAHEVYTPADKPSGVIYAQLKRNDMHKQTD